MKSKTVILMVVAVGCGLVASFLTSRLLAERGKTPDGPVMQKYLVAKKSLPVGTVLKDPEKLFEEKDFPEDSAPRKGFQSFDQARNMKLSKPISADAPLSKDDVLGGDKNDFEASIPPGHQAIAIKVDQASIAGGFVRPLSRVDVIWTLSRGEGSLTKVILQNLVVLAADMEAGRDVAEGGGQAKAATTVTLAVKPDEAQAITLAQSSGQLTLKLRKTGDEEIDQTRALTLIDLIKRGHTVGAGGSDIEDPESGTKPTKPTKPTVAEPTDPTPPPEVVKPKEPEYFVQIIYNGPNKSFYKHRLDGKDSDDTVDKSPPDEPVKKPEPPKTPEKPTTDKDSDDK